MADKFSDIPDDQLEAHVRQRVTPEMVEYLRRQAEAGESPWGSPSSAQFNHRLGQQHGKRHIHDDFQRLLSEASDPEYQR